MVHQVIPLFLFHRHLHNHHCDPNLPHFWGNISFIGVPKAKTIYIWVFVSVPILGGQAKGLVLDKNKKEYIWTSQHIQPFRSQGLHSSTNIKRGSTYRLAYDIKTPKQIYIARFPRYSGSCSYQGKTSRERKQGSPPYGSENEEKTMNLGMG